jgi:hypothetical protein
LLLLFVPGQYGVIVFGFVWLVLGGLVIAARQHLDSTSRRLAGDSPDLPRFG